jgi:hypothetical protein
MDSNEIARLLTSARATLSLDLLRHPAPGTPLDKEHFFCHSFPRPRDGRDQFALGLRTLESIVKYGLLLAPETRRFSEPVQGQTTEGPGAILLAQKRICLTHLAPEMLRSHSEAFGPFSLQWKESALRSLGAIPVFYVPLQWSNGSLEGIGSALLARLAEIQAVLTRVEEIEAAAKQASSPAEAIILTRKDHPDTVSRLSAAGALDMIAMLEVEHQPIAVLRNALQALSGFFSPVEDLRFTTPLGYYQQREWRIIANMVHLDQAVTTSLPDPLRQRLLSDDADYWGASIEMPTGWCARIDQCQIFKEFRGRPIIETVHQVVVPNAAVPAVKQLLNSAGVSLPVVELESL